MNYTLLPIDLIVRSTFAHLYDRPSISQSEIDHAADYGIKTPVTVRKSRNALGLCYELIDGEREWMIAQAANIHEIPGIVHDFLSDEEAQSYLSAKISLKSDTNNAIVRAKSASDLLFEEEQKKPWGALTRSAHKLGMDKSTLKHLINLLKLDQRVQAMVEDGRLDQSKARLLCSIGKTQQHSLAVQIIEKNIPYHKIPLLLQTKIKGDESSVSGATKTITTLETSFQGSGNCDPTIASLEIELSEITGSPVRIEHLASNKGYISLQYFSLDELDGIMERLGKTPDDF